MKRALPLLFIASLVLLGLAGCATQSQDASTQREERMSASERPLPPGVYWTLREAQDRADEEEQKRSNPNTR